MIVLYTVIFKRLKQRERARSVLILEERNLRPVLVLCGLMWCYVILGLLVERRNSLVCPPGAQVPFLHYLSTTAAETIEPATCFPDFLRLI